MEQLYLMFLNKPHHDDSDADAHSADDVQLVVEHFIDGFRTALTKTNSLKFR